MAKTPINEIPKNGPDQIRVWIDADRRQLERALRQLTEGWPVKVAIDWTHADVGSQPTSARPEPESHARRLPVLERGGSRVRYLKVEEIDWIEAERQYVGLHVRDKTFLARGQFMTIKNLTSRLDPEHFMRVHRSHIVNLERVESLRVDAPAKRYAVLFSGREVPVSQAYWGQLEAALGGDGWR